MALGPSRRKEKMTDQPHILVIDDDDRLRDLLRRFLSESGFRVTDAPSAKDAHHLLSAFAFDLLVIDVVILSHHYYLFL